MKITTRNKKNPQQYWKTMNLQYLLTPANDMLLFMSRNDAILKLTSFGRSTKFLELNNKLIMI